MYKHYMPNLSLCNKNGRGAVDSIRIVYLIPHVLNYKLLSGPNPREASLWVPQRGLHNDFGGLKSRLSAQKSVKTD